MTWCAEFSVVSRVRKLERTKKLVLIILGFVFLSVHAQEVFNGTGGDASGSGGTVAYSVGQIVYTTNTGKNGTLAQGVQQPFEISIVAILLEVKGINLTVSAYPNPVYDFLILKIEYNNHKNLSYQLIDVNGKLIDSKNINGDQTIIAMGNLAPAMYFVKVIQINKEVKIFKIVKY